MVDNTDLDDKALSLPGPMAGPKLYGPGVIAAYTVLANFPVGLILYGLNLRARGQRQQGLVMLVFGVVCGVALVILAMGGAPLPFGILIGALAAAFIYKLEKRPFERAVAEGASKARWWPPALWLIAAVIVLLFIENFMLNDGS